MPQLIVKMTLFVLLLPISSLAESFSERWEEQDIQPDQLFYPPETEFEKRLFTTGENLFWKDYPPSRYERGYKGYILFADPYHYGMSRISFLLGADCSHFIHRIYQVLGAGYPFAKTRHFLALSVFLRQQELSAESFYLQRGREQGLLDISPCHWQKLTESFRLVDEAVPGDIIVYQKRRSWRGPNGHMAVIQSLRPLTLLHARSPKYGISENKVSQLPEGAWIFRFQKRLVPMKTRDLRKVHLIEYPADPSGCR